MDVESEEIVASETDTTEEVVKTTDDSVEETLEPEHTEFEKKQFERAKKAEAENKKLKEQLKAKATEPVAKTDGFSLKDSYALQDAKVHIDDIDDVAEFAKFKNISIPEALKTNAVKAILADKVESRKVADASNTGIVKRGSTKLTDDQMLAKADKGEMPDDADALAEAVMKAKKAKLQK